MVLTSSRWRKSMGDLRAADWVKQDEKARQSVPEALEIMRKALEGRASPNDLSRVREIAESQGGIGKREIFTGIIKLLPTTLAQSVRHSDRSQTDTVSPLWSE
jgi:hypothetical protein